MELHRCSVARTESGPPYTYTCGGSQSTVLASRAVVGASISLSNLALTAGAGTALGQLRLVPILSGSMSPAIEAGDAVVVRRARLPSVRIGDVVTYHVSQSGGAIGVESRQGQGTAFSIFLPTVDEATPPPRPAVALEPMPGSETILLVEDEPAVRDLLVQILEHCGYTVLEAADPIAALETSRSRDGIDLLLTDVVMPHMSGPALAKRIVARHPQTLVIFMSGYTDGALEEGVLEGNAAFLQKPFSSADLALIVRQSLDRRAA